MIDVLWFLTRSSGIVAMILIAAAIIDGFVYSGHEGGQRIRPEWWVDLHRGLGGYALIFTVFHLLTAYGADLGYRVIDIIIPGVSKQWTTAVTLGVLAFYAMLITVFTTWPKRKFRSQIWHAIHLLTLPATIAIGVHGWQMGTDSRTGWYIALMAILTGLVMYPAGLRISGLIRTRQNRRRKANTSTPSALPDFLTSPPSPPASSSARSGGNQ